jgi:opacity protein-like surface antigen
MKKYCLVLGLLMLFAVPGFAGTVNISGRAGIFTPSGQGASASLMYGVGAEYEINQNWSVRGALETTTYSINNVQTTYTPVTVDLIYSQHITENITPYAGAGLSYNTTSVGGVTTQTSGGQAEVGIRFALGGLSAGFEVRYLIPDANKMDKGITTYNGYATGSFSQSISF